MFFPSVDFNSFWHVTPLYSVLKELTAVPLCKVWAVLVSYVGQSAEEGKKNGWLRVPDTLLLFAWLVV